VTRTPEAARQRWVILAVIVLAQTVANVGPLGIPAIASLIRDDLGLTLTQAGSFLSVYYLGPVTMSFFAGMLADRWGTAKTLVLGQALIAGGLLAASTAGSYGVLLALLGIAGVGYGTLNPASTTAAMSWFPPRQRATVVGLKQVGLPFGGMLGAALMPALALRLGWRWAIAAGALAIVACAALCATVYRDPTGEAPLRRAAGQRGRGGAALAGPLAGRQRHAGVRRDADRLDGVPRPLSPRVRRARAARGEPVPGARPGGRRARARRVRRALRSHVRRPPPHAARHRRLRVRALLAGHRLHGPGRGTMAACSTPSWPSSPGRARPAPRSGSGSPSPRSA